MAWEWGAGSIVLQAQISCVFTFAWCFVACRADDLRACLIRASISCLGSCCAIVLAQYLACAILKKYFVQLITSIGSRSSPVNVDTAFQQSFPWTRRGRLLTQGPVAG